MYTTLKNRWSAPWRYHDLSTGGSISAFMAIVISAYGREGIFSTLADKQYYSELIVLFLCAGSVAGWVALVSRLLDRFYDWHDRTLSRILWQVLLGVFMSSLIAYLLSAYYFRFTGGDIEKTTFMSFAFPPLVLIIVFFNSYYYLVYIFYKQQAISQRQQVLTLRLMTMHAQRKPPVYSDLQIAGQQISQAEIAWCYCKKKRSYVKNFSGNMLHLACPLDELYQQLDPKSFFRINRQLVISRHACLELQPLSYGRLMLVARPALPEDMAIVTRLRSAAFQQWIKKGS